MKGGRSSKVGTVEEMVCGKVMDDITGILTMRRDEMR